MAEPAVANSASTPTALHSLGLAERAAAVPTTQTWWHDAARRFLSQRLPVAAAIILLAMALISLFAPLLAPHDPTKPFREGLSELGAPLPPNSQFWLGTDGIGRDLFSRLIYGGRISLGIGISASAISVLIAIIAGGGAAFLGGMADFWMTRFIDMVMSMPTFFVMLLLVVMLEPGAWVVITVIAIFAWTYPARIFRSQILTLRQRDFVIAARASGAPSGHIFIRHILPHLLPLVIVYLALGIPSTIFAEASLSFLGLGVPPPAPSWGAMIQEGMAYYRAAPWTAFFPGFAIALTVVCFNLVGTGLRDAMDPTRKGR